MKTAAAFRSNDPKKLYHSPMMCEFNCGEHAPRRINDTSLRNCWRAVTQRDHAEWPVDELGPIQCEVCRSIARREAESKATDGGEKR